MITGPGASKEFTDIADVAVSDKGDIYVADVLNAEVDVFDTSGAFLRTFARKGHGPGELQHPRGIAWSRDTVLVLDRLAELFTEEGKYLGQLRPSGYDMGLALQVIPTDSGWAVLQRVHSPNSPESGIQLDSMKVFNTDARTKTMGRATQLAELRTYWFLPGSFSGPVPLDVQEVTTVMPNGTILRSVGDSFHIQVASIGAGVTRSIRGCAARVRVSKQDEQDWESRIPIQVKIFPPDMRAQVEAGLKSAPHAEYRPVIGNMIASNTGKVLIQRFDLSARPYAVLDTTQSALWTVLDSKFMPHGVVHFPLRFTPRSFIGCKVTGVYRDLDDNKVVVQYSIADDGPGGSLGCNN